MALTPMMTQYMEIKNKHKDCLVFYRLGDFYEMFFEDALIASRDLELTLTGRDCGLEERAPMCGVPHRAAGAYIAKLIEKGHKVAICEQMEEAGKGMIHREVVRVITAGTVIEDQLLDAGANNYICCVYKTGEAASLAYADVSTGLFTAAQFKSPRDGGRGVITAELSRLGCKELIVNETFDLNITQMLGFEPTYYSKEAFSLKPAMERLLGHFDVTSLSVFGVMDNETALIRAAGALLTYLFETQKHALAQITKLTTYRQNGYMRLDAGSRRHLELTKSVRGVTAGSLLWALDYTKTSMGARMLRRWVESPLYNTGDITTRQEAVAEFYGSIALRDELRRTLGGIKDMERLVGKIATSAGGTREMHALRASLDAAPHVRSILSENNVKSRMNIYFAGELNAADGLREKIAAALIEDPPPFKDGGFVRDGYRADLDEYRAAKRDGGAWLLALETEEREATGIRALKIKHSNVFGYCFEISNSYLKNVPQRFIRRQTLANCERFTTERLREIEEKITGAEDAAIAIENRVFNELREAVLKEAPIILETANQLAAIDALQSLSEAAAQNNYTMPEITEDGAIKIKDGRHPVIERVGAQRFIPNDTALDMRENRVMILTGPNMAGKSTYMRQIALIIIMAQIGSFVPAARARISLCDSVFTRVGASDDLATGQSTFMVEMNEVANILNNATDRSFIALDEIGRGTSTFDGLAIAWSVLEYIADTKKIGAKTIFATHYHEMTELAGKVDGVFNRHVAVKESAGGIIFLRKVISGGAGHSYGVSVARLAKLPEGVISRADELLRRFDNTAAGLPPEAGVDLNAPPLYVIDELKKLKGS